MTTSLGVVSALLVAGPITAAQAQSKESDRKLGAADKARVDRAVATGTPTVTLLVAAAPNRASEAAADLRALGGQVEARNATVDYVKVEMPTEQVERAAKLQSVSAVDVDGLIPLDDPRVDGASAPVPQTPPGADTPRINPYLPTGDTGAAQFALANPQWDGRGVKVAILDTGVDLDHPALKTTTSGAPKIVDWYNANSPTSGDATWISTSGRFTGTFTAGGSTWAAPETGGPYAFGVFRDGAVELFSGEIRGDVDRDGVHDESFGVLQDRITKRVYVDLDQDKSFTDETAMIDFKVNRDVGHFGTDDPTTRVVERVPFVVVTDRSEYDPDSDAGSVVNLGIAGAQHGTHVAGIAAGNGLFGGAMSGAAPGAQVMAIKVCLTTPSCTASGLIDGVLYAARNGADVANISIGGLPALNDANNARAVLYDRTIDEYNIQLLISAGNSGAGANTVGDPSVTTNSVSVGASITDATWRVNYGSLTDSPFAVMPFSSRGPREDGGLKPTVVAPGSAISTTPLWQAGGPVAGTYDLPPGYSMLAGTSMAAPEATGAAALLVSAYKATFGERPTAAALRSAIVSGARFQSNAGAYEQGAGLIDVGRAWEQLRAGQNPHRIVSSVPVSTVLSNALATPDTGVGIHDREGVAVGDKYHRIYTLTRTTGPERAVRHEVTWIGNDGTFSSRDHVMLPLNERVQLNVKVEPRSAGIHSALLQLDDSTTHGVDLTTMNTVFAPFELSTANDHRVTVSGTVARNDTEHVLVRVPEGTRGLTVDMTGGGPEPGKGQLRFLRYTPQGLPADNTSSSSCYHPNAGGGCSGGAPTSRTASNPQAGVWEVVVESRRTSDAAQAPFSLTITAQSATIAPDPDTVASATVGEPLTRQYTVTNRFGEFTGRLVGGPLGSTQTQRPTIEHRATQSFDVTLPAGVLSYTVRTGGAADSSADIDLFVLRCDSTCVLVGSSASPTDDEEVTLRFPAAARYQILVEGFDVQAGSTAYDLVDTYVSPALGTLTSNDTDALHPAGSSWSPTATLTVASSPGAGRKITGVLQVRRASGTVIGDSTLVVDAVN
jgi:subtilisin family serine protease